MKSRRGPAAGRNGPASRSHERLLEELAQSEVCGSRVLEAMREVPRHLFVDDALAHRSYENTALPIGHAQTISQPYIVALMSELAIAGEIPERVLEIGAGSGYQAAVLSRLARQVYSMERISALLGKARRRLNRLGIHRVHFRFGDGHLGWPEKAPFDAIVVTAACTELPQALVRQLKEGGRLVVPVGEEKQRLRCCRRRGEKLECETVEAVNFVPMLEGVTHN